MTPTVGIIGGGFVGGAIAHGFSLYTDVKVYDTNPGRSTHNIERVLEQDILFVCLPTPMKIKTGDVDTSIIEPVLRRLNQHFGERGYNGITILKSTVPFFHLETWANQFTNLQLFYSPEFLTERTADLDFQQQNRLIFGSLHGTKDQFLITLLFEERFPQVPLYWTTFREACLIKYFTNTFFATKVSLFNEFYDICKAADVSYDEVIGLMMMDPRIGRSHFKVPGPDGKRGFGGHCFPKDVNGYFTIAKNLGLNPTVGYSAWIKNLEIRPEKDWEQDKGRAVSEDPSD